MGRFNPDVAIQEISSDPRIANRLIKAGQFQGNINGASTHTAGGVGAAVYVPIDFGAGGYADLFSINCTTLGVTSQYRLALYKQATNGQPGGLVLDLGALDVTATGVKVSTAAAVKVAGIMYVLCSPQGSNVAVISGAATGASLAYVMAPLIVQASAVAAFFTSAISGYTEAGVTAAPPATATPVLAATSLPVVVWRWSALPLA